MKRSLKNQLITQFGYAMMLNNTICTPCLTWRILFGPVHIEIAAFTSFIENFSVTWLFLCLTESFVIKALMLFKFPHMAGLDDSFMARVFLLSNLGFLCLCNGSRTQVCIFVLIHNVKNLSSNSFRRHATWLSKHKIFTK